MPRISQRKPIGVSAHPSSKASDGSVRPFNLSDRVTAQEEECGWGIVAGGGRTRSRDALLAAKNIVCTQMATLEQFPCSGVLLIRMTSQFRRSMGAGGIEPLVGHLTCFSTTDLQSAVRKSSRFEIMQLSNAVGGIRTHTVENLILVPPANWATTAIACLCLLHWPGRESNPQLLELKSSASASWATRPADARTFRAIDQGGSRTHTISVLSAAPLPIGLPGRFLPSVFRDVHSPCSELELFPVNC